MSEHIANLSEKRGNTALEENGVALMGWGSRYLLASMQGRPFREPKPKMHADCDNVKTEVEKFVPPKVCVGNPFKQRWRVAAALCEYLANEYGMSGPELQGKGRSRRFVEPRAIAMKLLHEQGGTYAEIGRRFKRDHSTVIHSCTDVFNRTQAVKRNVLVYRSLQRLAEVARKEHEADLIALYSEQEAKLQAMGE